MKKIFLGLSLIAASVFAEPNTQGINEILSKSLDRLEQSKDNNATEVMDSPDAMVNVLNNQEKILNLFKATFFFKKVNSSGVAEKSIFVTDKNKQEAFVELKEGSKFGVFTIKEIHDTYVSYTIADDQRIYTKAYTIISSSENNKKQ